MAGANPLAVGAIAVGAFVALERWAKGSRRTMTADQVLPLINQLNAAEHNDWFHPADVLAVVAKESAFNPNAYRYEPRLGDASFGLMQVLSKTAADRGFKGDPRRLFEPLEGLRYGMRQLAWTYDYLAARLGRPPSREEWFGGYNAGVGNVLRGYIPLAYVQAVERLRAQYA